eukprot:TRINITY_DN42_c1_g1_i3.p1 TRINITY_DN42_c1_g1~~TRINITY_DN42_c1_g1_i3.p1  ORF type:complete len:233 (+),score=58.56 TRINITY_DN42_c1_g1_i3:66-701(+)
MKTFTVMFGLLASAAAQDCSTLTINKQSSTCNLGSTPADTDTITACAATLCGLMDTWDMAHGADVNKRLMGSGYGCYVEDGTGAGDIICQGSSPPTPPTPIPPPDTPTPPGPPTPPTPDTPSPTGPTPPPGPPAPKKKDDGLTDGGIFLIVFFVGGFLYFALGAAFMYKVKGERGVNMIPNVNFWKDLPFLMKDGAVFLKNKICRGGYQSV